MEPETAALETPPSALQPYQKSPSMLSPSMLSPVFDPSFALDAALLQSTKAPERACPASRTPLVVEIAGAWLCSWTLPNTYVVNARISFHQYLPPFWSSLDQGLGQQILVILQQLQSLSTLCDLAILRGASR